MVNWAGDSDATIINLKMITLYGVCPTTGW